MYVLAFDPGGTTGVCGGKFDIETNYNALDPLTQQLDAEDHTESLGDLLDLVLNYEPNLQVVTERFRIRHGKPADLRAIHYNDVIETWCKAHMVPFEEQDPAQVKSFWTDAKLKHLGLWPLAGRHSRDAARHMLAYTIKASGLASAGILWQLRPVE